MEQPGEDGPDDRLAGRGYGMDRYDGLSQVPAGSQHRKVGEQWHLSSIPVFSFLQNPN